MAKVRVGINGFGRIGRILFRAGFDQVEVVGINELGNLELAAHLLRWDSTHGAFPGEVKTEGQALVVNGKKIPVSSERNPGDIPWKQWEVDVVLECTGAFAKKKDLLEQHLAGGAKKVLVSAPSVADLTVVFGVNHQTYDPSKHHIISNASCTTNCLAPVVKVLNDSYGITQGLMTTIHSYTNDQRVLDAPHSDFRRARSAAMSMIPTTTGAAQAVGKVLPELNGKLHGMAIRVPTPNVSVVDFTLQSDKPLSVEGINSALTKSARGELKGILAVEDEPLVSSDFNGNTNSSIVDLPSTMVVGDKMAKVLSWYDNEVGFSHRMVEMANFMADRGL